MSAKHDLSRQSSIPDFYPLSPKLKRLSLKAAALSPKPGQA
jgi:hypothetical protein